MSGTCLRWVTGISGASEIGGKGAVFERAGIFQGERRRLNVEKMIVATGLLPALWSYSVF